MAQNSAYNDSIVVFGDKATLIIPSGYSRRVYSERPRLKYGSPIDPIGNSVPYEIFISDLKQIENFRFPWILHDLDGRTSGTRTLLGGLVLKRERDFDGHPDTNPKVEFTRKEYARLKEYFNSE